MPRRRAKALGVWRWGLAAAAAALIVLASSLAFWRSRAPEPGSTVERRPANPAVVATPPAPSAPPVAPVPVAPAARRERRARAAATRATPQCSRAGDVGACRRLRSRRRPDPLVALVRAVQEIPGGRVERGHGARQRARRRPLTSSFRRSSSRRSRRRRSPMRRRARRPRRTVMSVSFVPAVLPVVARWPSGCGPRSSRLQEPPRRHAGRRNCASGVTAAARRLANTRSAAEQNVQVDVTASTLKGADKPVVKSRCRMVAADGRQARARRPDPVQRRARHRSRGPSTYRASATSASTSTRAAILASGKSAAPEAELLDGLSRRHAGGPQPSFGNGSHEVDGIVFDSGKPIVVTRAPTPKPAASTPSR